MITGPFSERWKRSKQLGQPIVYHYDTLPCEFRVQVATILLDTLGNYRHIRRSRSYSIVTEPSASEIVWEAVHSRIAFYRGVFELVPGSKSEQDAVVEYLQEAETLPALDAIELIFSFVDDEPFRSLGEHRRRESAMYTEPDAAIDKLNRAFRRHDLGYFFTGGMIVRIDNTFMHAEVVEPAIALLHEAEFEGASDEFLSAHRHYRRGEFKDAITDANNAFESTLKTICRKRGISISGKEKTEQLVDMVVRVLIPSHMQTYFDGLRSAMKGLPVLRNNTAGAAHGQGETPQDVVDHAASFALHLTAANIVFLIEAWKELEQREPRS